MKTWSRLILAVSILGAFVVACSSSSGSGGSSSGLPQCQNPSSTGPSSAACNSCLESSCSSQISAAEGPCSGYFSCYSACSCSDAACLSNCEGQVENNQACQQAYGNVVSCLTNSCASPCNA